MQLLFTFWCLFSTVFWVQEYDIKELRNLLNEGKENKNAAESLYKKVGSYNGEDPLILGYKASAYALRAKYSGNPLKKLKSIKTASRLFNDAVNRDGRILELRFMRYAVEVQTPKVLDLSEHVNEDKAILMEALRKFPKSDFTPETARIARDFLQQFCNCSETEKQELAKVKL